MDANNIARANLLYIEDLYESYIDNPTSVSQQWRTFFSSYSASSSGLSVEQVRKKLVAYSKQGNYRFVNAANNVAPQDKDIEVYNLVNAYRRSGHLSASIDPIKLQLRNKPAEIKLKFYKFSSTDKDKIFATDIECLKPKASLAKITATLENIYSHNIGSEYMHLVDSSNRQWLQKYIERQEDLPLLLPQQKKSILASLVAATGWEKYLHTAFSGAKRFSLEGGETLLPLLDTLIQSASKNGIGDVVLGMAHRGRLNLLVNLLGKLPQDLFDEFAGKKEIGIGSGDVKYHQGFAATIVTANGKVNASILYNPSHLEIVSPVTQGITRAIQDCQRDDLYTSLPIVIHGDAAFSGQGVVMETFQLSQTRGYTTGGSIHIVVNNQVGFTTHEEMDARSTTYCTDVAKVINAPVFHVNSDDPEAVVFIATMAVEYRVKFKADIVIDLVCYRRWGHNETDDPTITQPVMYQKIASHPTTCELYAQRLIADGVINQQNLDELHNDYRAWLKAGTLTRDNILAVFSKENPVNDKVEEISTAISPKKMEHISSSLAVIPAGFTPQRQVAKMLSDRNKMFSGNLPLDWGCAEILAYASLLDEKYNIRLTGQDVARGTFSHRHAVLFDNKTGQAYTPLHNLTTHKWQFNLYNSLLSEEAVVAFEYGYTTSLQSGLVIWEAQFGDFANVAQVVIDQFITSAQTKWGQSSNLTMLLPHGQEGQGSEHSSARLERFLQLCGDNNIKVCIPTNAAQIFHLLRLQALSSEKKPLIIMSPKSLLRHKRASCSLSDLTKGRFNPILHTTIQNKDKITKVIITYGKVYYELEECVGSNTLLLRIEQLYPFPLAELKQILTPLTKVASLVWCQDEPQNQGAWTFCFPYLTNLMEDIMPQIKLKYAGRDASSSPAPGSMKLYNIQQQKLLDEACI